MKSIIYLIPAAIARLIFQGNGFDLAECLSAGLTRMYYIFVNM